MSSHTTADEQLIQVQAEFNSSSVTEEVTTRRGAYGEESDQDDVVTQRNIPAGSVELNDYTNEKAIVDKQANTKKDPSSPIMENLSERSIDGCDNEQTFPEEEANAIDYSLLDWNKVFHFLANQLDATKSILFFNTLYGNTYHRGELNSSTKYKQVENDTKLRLGICDTVTLLVEQFKAWKEYAGKNIKHSVISRSLQDLNLNETFDKFHSFMRDPPMLAPICQKDVKEDCQWSSDQKYDVIPFSMGQSPQFNLKRCYYAIEQSSYCIGTRKAPDGVPDNLEISKCCDQAPIHHGKRFLTKRMNTEAVNCPSREENPCNDAAGSNSVSLIETHLSMTSFWLLIKKFVISSNEYLLHDMYQIILRDTISKVILETAKSADVILSLMYQDFLDADKMKTKKETIVVIYSNETRLVFGESCFSDLSFYAEHARKQVVDRLGENYNKEDEDLVYLFIGYNGKRICSKLFPSNEIGEADGSLVYVQDVNEVIRNRKED